MKKNLRPEEAAERGRKGEVFSPQSRRECCSKCYTEHPNFPSHCTQMLMGCCHTKSVEGESWGKGLSELVKSRFEHKRQQIVIQELATFITDLLAKERERLATAVEGLNKVHGTGFSNATVKRKAFNAALKEATKLIRNSNNL